MYLHVSIASHFAVAAVVVFFGPEGNLSLWNAVLIDLGTLLVVIANGTRPLLFKGVYERSSLDKFMRVPIMSKDAMEMV